MIKYVEKLEANPSGVFATIEDGKVKTRVFQYLFAEDNKVYFCTNNEKPVYKQIKENEYVSFCVHSSDFSDIVSVNGKAVFQDDVVLKEKVLDAQPGIKSIYKTADNPVFEVFYVDVEEVVTFGFAEGSKTYKI